MARKAKGRHAAQRGSFRIIGGQWRGRRLEFLDDGSVRPSTDRVRETLFNWAAPHIRGARCLDLFAGSGALGLEALSRGANELVFVDTQAAVISRIGQHLQTLGTTATVLREDARAYLSRPGSEFDLVFLDPPFRQDIVPGLLEALVPRLAPQSHVYLEVEQDLVLDMPVGYEVLKQKTAGQVRYHWLAFSGSCPQNDCHE